MNSRLRGIWQEYKGLLGFLVLMFVFRSAVADWNQVPSSSMNPTLWAGDRVGVNKLAYSLRVPFTLTEITRWANPQRGDVITFDSPADEVNLIKRVVAVAGDQVSMFDNTLVVNGQTVERTAVQSNRLVPTEHGLSEQEIWTEVQDGRRHEVARIPEANRYTGFAPVTVPAGHVMVMGDSRDNSNDSRFIGFIDVHRITGRAERVVLSLDPARFFLPRTERFWLPLSTPAAS